MRNMKGFTLIELLIVVAIIAILAAIAVPNFLEAQVRSKVSRVLSDMRSIATAVETYYVDTNTYPALAVNTDLSADRIYISTGGKNDRGRTFRLRGTAANPNANNLSTITTPVAYISSYFSDPFADTRGLTHRYYSDRAGFILGSYGPDTDEADGGDCGWDEGSTVIDNNENGIETVYDSQYSQPSPFLIAGSGSFSDSGGRTAFTYDPTNGTVSQGDVWRVKD